jgi:molecular chaperone GrpE
MMENKVQQEEKNTQQEGSKPQNKKTDIQPDQELNEAEGAENDTPPVEEEKEEKKEEKIDPFKRLQDDLAEAKDKYIRLYAEFENHRRRTSKEKLELIQSANEQLIMQLLPVIDDFDRAEKSFGESKEGALDGFLLIRNKLKKILEQQSVKVMDTTVGSDFNPDLHEAITQVKAEENNKGKIVDIIEKGYILNEKVIRYAKVVVGN